MGFRGYSSIHAIYIHSIDINTIQPVDIRIVYTLISYSIYIYIIYPLPVEVTWFLFEWQQCQLFYF